MGCYDTFGELQIQLKNGPCTLTDYRVGDRVHEEYVDGIYVSYEGYVVIKDGVFIAEFPLDHLWNKWGGNIHVDVSQDNPIQKFLESRESQQGS